MTHKADSYGPGKSYNIFAGKDGSRGLGKSSLKVEDAVADYSTLGAPEKKVLDDWHSFFSCVYFLSDVRSFFRDFSFSLFFSENVTILSEKFLMVQILSHRRQIKLLGFPRLLDGVVAFTLFVTNASPYLHFQLPNQAFFEEYENPRVLRYQNLAEVSRSTARCDCHSLTLPKNSGNLKSRQLVITLIIAYQLYPTLPKALTFYLY